MKFAVLTIACLISCSEPAVRESSRSPSKATGADVDSGDSEDANSTTKIPNSKTGDKYDEKETEESTKQNDGEVKVPDVIPDPNPTPTPNPNPNPTPTPKSTRLAGGYYPNWTEAPPRIKDINPAVNLIYLFAAKPLGGSPGTTGALTWQAPGNGKGAATNLKADIAYARSMQKRKIILSVGGAGAGMSFPNRKKSQTFVDSITTLYQSLGGFDGMDWNTFEADQAPDTAEMIWISLELKRLYPGFIISAPPAPWNAKDKDFCTAMVKAGAMDFAAPQYYDGPNLATAAYIEKSVDEWVKLLGAKHVMVGFGIWNKANYMNIADATSTWKKILAKYPEIAGGFDWSLALDEQQGWPYATQLAPLINP